MILKLKKNLIMNLTLMMVNFQEKEDLEKLENALVNQKNLQIQKLKLQKILIN